MTLKAQRGSSSTFVPILNLGLCQIEIHGQRQSQTPFPLLKSTDSHCTGYSGGPRDLLDRYGEDKTYFPHRVSYPGP